MAKYLLDIGNKALPVDICTVGGTQVNKNDADTVTLNNRMKA